MSLDRIRLSCRALKFPSKTNHLAKTVAQWNICRKTAQTTRNTGLISPPMLYIKYTSVPFATSHAPWFSRAPSAPDTRSTEVAVLWYPSISEFSIGVPSTTLYASTPFHISWLLKSTNWAVVIAAGSAIRRSRAILQYKRSPEQRNRVKQLLCS